MERSFDIVILLDIYGELLANAQREALDMRYNADLSLSEIAEEMGGVTRQSVVYSIRKGEQRLMELEEKLGFAKRLHTLSAHLDRAGELLSEIAADNSDERLKEVNELLSAVKREL